MQTCLLTVSQSYLEREVRTEQQHVNAGGLASMSSSGIQVTSVTRARRDLKREQLHRTILMTLKSLNGVLTPEADPPI